MKTFRLALALALLLCPLASAEETPYSAQYGKARKALEAGDKAGYVAGMIAALETLPLGHPNRPGTLYELAKAHAMAGDPQASLDALTRLWNEKAEAALVFYAETDPPFAAVRSLAGFRELLGRVGEIQLQIHPVRGNVHRIEGAGCTIAASVGPDGILLVDTGYGPLAGTVREALRKLAPTAPNAPVRFLVNTHHHEDHSAGNARFSSEARVIGHPAARAEMSKPHDFLEQTLPARPEAGLPTLTSDRPVTIHFNGEEILILPIPGHTPGDLAVIFKGSGVVHLGDAYFPSESAPLIDPGKDVDGFLRNADELLRQVPGGAIVLTGHEPPVAGMEEFQARIRNLRVAIDFLRPRIAAGEGPEEIERQVPKAGLPFPLPGPWIRYLVEMLTSPP